MNTTAESRRASLISITYFAVIIVAFWLFLKYAFWLFAPFIFATALAIILQKPINTISRKSHLPKGFVSIVSLILIIAFFLGVIGLVGYKIYDEMVGFKDFLYAKINDLPNLIKSLENVALRVAGGLPKSLKKDAVPAIKDYSERMLASAEDGAELTDLLKKIGFSFSGISDKISDSSISITGIASPVISTAMKLPSKLVGLLIFFIASFFLTSGYDDLVNQLKNALKKTTAAKLSTVKRITFNSLGKMAKSYAIIICITFCEISIGLFILRFAGCYTGGHEFILAICTALLDILPVFGTGTVLIPWAAYNLVIAHNIGLGIGLLIIYAVITIARQVIEPKLVGANLGMPPILTLMGMYIGLETIGVIGMFVLPITFVVIKMLNQDGVIHIWGEKRELATEKLPDQEPLIKPVVQKITYAVKHSSNTKRRR